VGYLDERVDDLQQGIDDLAAGDEIRQTNQLLAILIEQMGGSSSNSYFQDGFEETAPGETSDGRRTATYSSVEGLPATVEAADVTWGFIADTVVVRDLDQAAQVAFKDPDQHGDAWITIDPADSPFVVSGVYGIATSKMWFKRPDSTASDHTFSLLSVKRRGRD